MSFDVVRYEHPSIFVKDIRTNAIHEFPVNEDRTLASGLSRSDLGDARRAAIRYLYNLRQSSD